MTTYGDREASVAASAPIELYRFSRDDGDDVEQWFYANAEESILFRGDLYSACPGIHRSNIQQSGEDTTMQLTVDLPIAACVTEELAGNSAPSPILITVFRKQRGLADSEAATIFNGEVSGATFHDSTCTITGTSEESAWSDGLTRLFCQRTCPHMLFDTFCGADPIRVTFTAKITDLSDDLKTVTVDELDSPDDHLGDDSTFYLTGFVALAGRNFFVSRQAGHVLQLQTPLLGAAVDDVMTATAGCNRETSDCLNVHDNIERFGGFPLIPIVSPWQGLS